MCYLCQHVWAWDYCVAAWPPQPQSTISSTPSLHTTCAWSGHIMCRLVHGCRQAVQRKTLMYYLFFLWTYKSFSDKLLKINSFSTNKYRTIPEDCKWCICQVVKHCLPGDLWYGHLQFHSDIDTSWYTNSYFSIVILWFKTSEVPRQQPSTNKNLLQHNAKLLDHAMMVPSDSVGWGMVLVTGEGNNINYFLLITTSIVCSWVVRRRIPV